MTKVIGIIPARGGSKGVVDKNLQFVGDWTLVQRTIKYGLVSNHLDALIISSDSNEILKSASEVCLPEQVFGYTEDFEIDKVTHGEQNRLMPVLLQKRPSFLSQDNSRIVDLLNHLLRQVEKNTSQSDAFYFLLLQPTSPFRQTDEIDRFLEASGVLEVPGSAISVKEVQDEHPARMYTLSEGTLTHLGLYPDFEFFPRQELPKLFLRDGGYYFLHPETIRSGRMVSDTSQYFIRKFPYSLNIDKPEDLIFANFLIETGQFIENLK